MNKIPHESPDPEDMFSDTRMSFGDHLEDLRAHLIRAALGFGIGMAISLFFLGQYVLQIIVSPVEEQLTQFEKRMQKKEFQEARERMRKTGIDLPTLYVELDLSINDLAAAIRKEPMPPPVLEGMMRGVERLLDELSLLPELDKDVLAHQGNYQKIRAKISDPRKYLEDLQILEKHLVRKRLSTLGITEAFMVYFKVSLMTGLVLSSPWVFYHIWAFIAAGLYPQEKRLVNVYLPFSLFLFLTGVIGCQFLVMPKAIEAMLWFNEWLAFSPDLRLNEWLGFAIMMPVIFGISFQTPLVMMFLHKIGILGVQVFRDKRRIAWFVMAVFAAVITPTVDPFTMLFLWVPMGGLYELGILLCVWQGDKESLAEWEIEEKRGELVEV